MTDEPIRPILPPGYRVHFPAYRTILTTDGRTIRDTINHDGSVDRVTERADGAVELSTRRITDGVLL